MRALVVAICMLLGASGCRASASAKADVNTGKSKDFMDEPIQASRAEPAEDDSALEPDADQALIGARHDLRLASNVTTASCKCLAVAVGAANDPTFSWIGEPPRVDPDRQLVIAFSSDGIACPEQPQDTLGASYWGFRRDGEDVLVIVETAKLGRPITSGAIIPKPTGNGHVYLRPASKATPYARPLDSSQKDCKAR